MLLLCLILSTLYFQLDIVFLLNIKIFHVIPSLTLLVMATQGYRPCCMSYKIDNCYLLEYKFLSLHLLESQSSIPLYQTSHTAFSSAPYPCMHCSLRLSQLQGLAHLLYSEQSEESSLKGLSSLTTFLYSPRISRIDICYIKECYRTYLLDVPFLFFAMCHPAIFPQVSLP